MKHLFATFLVSLPLLGNAAELNLPLLPDEAKVIQGIAATEGVEVVLASNPGWSARGAADTLASLGVPKDDIASVTVHVKDKKPLAFTVTHDKAGHVLAITGSGPWLRNSTLRSFKALPELRFIRMVHNGFPGNDPRAVDFDGSGFDALTDSKLADIKIGLSFSDKGMEQCAKIKSLRSFGVSHSQATEAGIAFFAGHPGLTHFSMSEAGSTQITEKALGAIAKIPNLTRVGFGECYVTYAGGFALLAPFKGKLTQINLDMCLATQADFDKLQADHPQAKIIYLPLLPDEAKVIQGIAATEGVEFVLASKPGWSAGGAADTLASLGVPKGDIASATVQVKDGEAFTVTHDKAGHVLAITGNGPWLRNSTLRSFKALPELRFIRMDHNGFLRNDPRTVDFDGSGFDALTDSKLADIHIGLSFNDKGMEQCAKIKSLRSFVVSHSQATEAGIAFFAGHPGLTHFSMGEAGSTQVSEKALGAIAKIPNLTRVGLGECYVTYAGGFALLAPLKGKLTQINLDMCLATQADVDKLQADHPQAKIITTPVAEIAKRHWWVATNIAKQAPPEVAAPLNAAIEQVRKPK